MVQGLDQAKASDFDALFLPGSVIKPDRLWMESEAVAFVKEFFQNEKPVAAISYGPQALIDTGLAKGCALTSWPSIRTDLKNAGAEWVDRETVVDGNLVTSRTPADIPAFIERTISEWKCVLAGRCAHRKMAHPFDASAIRAAKHDGLGFELLQSRYPQGAWIQSGSEFGIANIVRPALMSRKGWPIPHPNTVF